MKRMALAPVLLCFALVFAQESPPAAGGPDSTRVPAQDSAGTAAGVDSARQAPDSVSSAPDSSIKETAAPAPAPRADIDREKKTGVENKVEVIQTYRGSVNQLRSPKKAFFLSFILPGLGEFYSRGHWARVAVPFGIELTSYVMLAVIRDQYNDLTQKYEEYADAHYSHAKFHEWYQYILNSDTSVVRVADIFSHDSIYYEVYRNKTSDFYEMIGKYDMFVQGWDDADPYMTQGYIDSQSVKYGSKYAAYAITGLGYDNAGGNVIDTFWMYCHEDANGNPDPKRPRYFGKSNHQITYMAKRDDANTMGDKMLWVFYGMLGNRILSAVDAVLVTMSTNRKITGGTLSSLERIRVRPAAIGGASPVTNGLLVTYSF